MEKIKVLYTDPPWKYQNDNTGTNIASNHYNLMGQDELKALPVKSILDKEAMVFMWATCPKLHYAIDLIQSWGLHYRGVAFVWVKTRKDGEIINGQGVPPTFTKPTTEMLLLATTKKNGRMVPLKKFNTAQVVLAPRSRHSEKPEIFRELIEETLDGDYTKLEMFARKSAPGWQVLGNEVGEKVDIKKSLQSFASKLTAK